MHGDGVYVCSVGWMGRGVCVTEPLLEQMKARYGTPLSCLYVCMVRMDPFSVY